MTYKKAMINWEILALSLIIAVGIIFFYNTTHTDIPEVSKFPTELNKELMKSRNIFIMNNYFMKSLAKNSVATLGRENMPLKTDCGKHLGYKLLNNENFNSCVDKNSDIKEEFKKIFEREFNNFKTKKAIELDYSNINYDLFVTQENNNFFLTGKTTDELKLFEEIDGGSVEIFSKPIFKVPIYYNFNDPAKVAEIAKELAEKCKNSRNYKKCIENNIDIFKRNNFELPKNCETEEKEKLLEFAEYFESCFNSKDKNCVCREKPNKENYNIIKTNNKVEIKGIINNKELSVNLDGININDDLDAISSDMALHKNEKGNLLVAKDIPTNPKCDIKPKTKFRFCFETNNVDYKFALQFPELKQES